MYIMWFGYMEEPHIAVTVKLSGDGAVIAAAASLVFLTFSSPSLAENVLSATGGRCSY